MHPGVVGTGAEIAQLKRKSSCGESQGIGGRGTTVVDGGVANRVVKKHYRVASSSTRNQLLPVLVHARHRISRMASMMPCVDVAIAGIDQGRGASLDVGKHLISF
jgi:hypothetical protein